MLKNIFNSKKTQIETIKVALHNVIVCNTEHLVFLSQFIT